MVLVNYFRILIALGIISIILSTNISLAQQENTHQTTHPSNPNSDNSNSTHATNPDKTVPANITFNKGLEKAREIITKKNQFKMIANT